MQDPVYSTCKQEYLTHLGIKYVNDPEGFFYVDGGTLFFGFRLTSTYSTQ